MTRNLPVHSPDQIPGRRPEQFSQRSRVITFTLAVFLGVLGVHRFYTGKVLTGLLMFLTGGGFGLWWAVDVMTILMGYYRDAEGLRLAPPTRQPERLPHHPEPTRRAVPTRAPTDEEIAERELDRLLNDPLADKFAELEAEMGQDATLDERAHHRH
ncbi:TM2 domain-containing protein [Bradymonadaceae bacterium TMQ3]|uniref:TM2 domain-containing protein n=1 Tax=Lujinxingia sediminis TaxID=2480984 RepID=A0ABY0CNR6_9DELT|nr:TM2 domain-containing protein [Lujinxingia sediminis]RDV36393.1 TM2 domain-containing protein [Bradymonadaceae bacterium TMQ3]RVU41492.1 TM2 domain-containing protein [Lujinxingia sediminis]TXC68482.1 TM2 domain-containing protein [Bradymonadales bacterium TMQ1]